MNTPGRQSGATPFKGSATWEFDPDSKWKIKGSALPWEEESCVTNMEYFQSHVIWTNLWGYCPVSNGDLDVGGCVPSTPQEILKRRAEGTLLCVLHQSPECVDRDTHMPSIFYTALLFFIPPAVPGSSCDHKATHRNMRLEAFSLASFQRQQWEIHESCTQVRQGRSLKQMGPEFNPMHGKRNGSTSNWNHLVLLQQGFSRTSHTEEAIFSTRVHVKVGMNTLASAAIFILPV